MTIDLAELRKQANLQATRSNWEDYAATPGEVLALIELAEAVIASENSSDPEFTTDRCDCEHCARINDALAPFTPKDTP